MNTKRTYVEKRQAQLEEYRARIKAMKSRAKRLVAEGKIKSAEELEHFDDRMTEAKLKLRKLQRAGEDSWKDVKSGVESAWSELTHAARTARAKFK